MDAGWASSHSKFVGLREHNEAREITVLGSRLAHPLDDIYLMIIFPQKPNNGSEASRYETPGSSAHVLFGYAQLASRMALA
jgi:hypothetical protein